MEEEQPGFDEDGMDGPEGRFAILAPILKGLGITTVTFTASGGFDNGSVDLEEVAVSDDSPLVHLRGETGKLSEALDAIALPESLGGGDLHAALWAIAHGAVSDELGGDSWGDGNVMVSGQVTLEVETGEVSAWAEETEPDFEDDEGADQDFDGEEMEDPSAPVPRG